MKKKDLSFLLIYPLFFLASAFTEMSVHDLQKLCETSTRNISLQSSSELSRSHAIKGWAKQFLAMPPEEDILPIGRSKLKELAPTADEFSAALSSYSTIDKAKLTLNTALTVPQSILTNSEELKILVIMDQLREKNLQKTLNENQNSKLHEN